MLKSQHIFILGKKYHSKHCCWHLLVMWWNQIITLYPTAIRISAKKHAEQKLHMSYIFMTQRWVLCVNFITRNYPECLICAVLLQLYTISRQSELFVAYVDVRFTAYLSFVRIQKICKPVAPFNVFSKYTLLLKKNKNKGILNLTEWAISNKTNCTPFKH